MADPSEQEVSPYLKEWLKELKELLDERDKRYQEKFLHIETIRERDQTSFERRLEETRNQVPTSEDHIKLQTQVDTLQDKESFVAGKASQSSVQIMLAIALVGIAISMCVAGLSLVTLLGHILNLF